MANLGQHLPGSNHTRRPLCADSWPSMGNNCQAWGNFDRDWPWGRNCHRPVEYAVELSLGDAACEKALLCAARCRCRDASASWCTARYHPPVVAKASHCLGDRPPRPRHSGRGAPANKMWPQVGTPRRPPRRPLRHSFPPPGPPRRSQGMLFFDDRESNVRIAQGMGAVGHKASLARVRGPAHAAACRRAVLGRRRSGSPMGPWNFSGSPSTGAVFEGGVSEAKGACLKEHCCLERGRGSVRVTPQRRRVAQGTQMLAGLTNSTHVDLHTLCSGECFFCVLGDPGRVTPSARTWHGATP